MRFNVIGVGMVVILAGCGRDPCARLARAVCEQAPNTPACERASRTTNSDECAGLMQDVARFIALANEKVETPVLQPPAPAGGPDAQGPAAEAPPVPAPAPGTTSAPTDPGSATTPASSQPSGGNP